MLESGSSREKGSVCVCVFVLMIGTDTELLGRLSGALAWMGGWSDGRTDVQRVSSLASSGCSVLPLCMSH